MACSDYPNFITKPVLERQLIEVCCGRPEEAEDIINIFLKVSYLGKKGEQLLNSLTKKLKQYLKPR